MLGAVTDYTQELVTLDEECRFPCSVATREDLRIATSTLEDWVRLRPGVFAVEGTLKETSVGAKPVLVVHWYGKVLLEL